MFTGIIEKVAKIGKAEIVNTELKLTIDTTWTDLSLGESVAVNGVCLTVAELHGSQALFFLSEETLNRSSLGKLKAGDRVNLERALQAGARLSGHIVQGHVDGLATFRGGKNSGDSMIMEFELPPNLSRYCVEKGSIALEGTSLTINELDDNRIRITMIPHTWQHTRFSDLKSGDPVNVEVDVLAKYTEKLCQPYLKH